jgi:hypothetical protein
MDFVNKMTGKGSSNAQANQPQQQGGSSSGGIMDKLHGMAGGGPESEKKEDSLDKGKFVPLTLTARHCYLTSCSMTWPRTVS